MRWEIYLLLFPRESEALPGLFTTTPGPAGHPFSFEEGMARPVRRLDGRKRQGVVPKEKMSHYLYLTFFLFFCFI